MKKILFLSAFAMSSFGFAQGLNCASATVLNASGTFTVPTINGTYSATPSCLTGTPSPAPNKGVWYKFTPTAAGSVKISSNLPQNDGVTNRDETRFSVYTGTCAALTCVPGASNDDASGTVYLSESTFSVSAGTTYYLQWDNSWMTLADNTSKPFDFSYTFSSCGSPTALAFSTLTTTSATITWTAPNPAPTSYDIEYGPLGFTQGSGTTANTTTTTYTFPAQAPGANLSFYIKSKCGAQQGNWNGPYNLFLVKPLPYSNNFDNDNNRTDGFSTTGGWSITGDDPTATPPLVISQSPIAVYFSNTSTTAVANSQLYTRPFDLVVGKNNNMSFYTRNYALTANGIAPMTLKVYRNSTRSMTGATQIGTAITVNGETYVQQNVTFQVPTSGTYYIILSNESALTANSTALLLDTFSISSTLATSEVAIDTTLGIFPNPTSDVLNIKSKGKVKSAVVYDLSGNKINVAIENNSVNVRELVKGTYVIEIETTLGKSNQKFIKK